MIIREIAGSDEAGLVINVRVNTRNSPWSDVLWCGVRKSLCSVAGSGELWGGGGEAV